MNELLEFAGWSGFAFSLSVATPMELLRKKIGLSNSDVCVNPTKHFFQELLNCPMCMGFWIGLVAYGSLAGGGLVFVGARLIDVMWWKLPIKTW